MDPYLRASLDLARNGIPNFPCLDNKRPRTKNGFKDATTDEYVINAWWDEQPWHMIGVPTGDVSGIIAVDCGAIIPERIEKFLAAHRRGTARQKTPSGGKHYLYRPDGKFVKNRGHQPGEPDVDIRGDGGYIIVPPSQNGRGAYEWTMRDLFSIERVYPREIEDILDKIQKPRRRSRRVAWRNPKRVAAGERHPAILAFVCGQYYRGVDPEQIVTNALEYNKEIPNPLPDERLDEIPLMVDWVVNGAEDAEDEFWESTPILSHIRKHSRSSLVAPWAVLGSVLTRVSALTSPAVQLPGRGKDGSGGTGSLNLFVSLLGEPGKGKDQAMRDAELCVNLMDDQLFVTRFGSSEGLCAVYKKKSKDNVETWQRHAALFQESEVETVANLGFRQGAGLLPELRNAWSGGHLGYSYVDPKKRYNMPAHSYRLSAILGVQPTKAGPFFEDTAGGFPHRLLWLQCVDRFADLDAEPVVPPVIDLGYADVDMAELEPVIIPVFEGARREIRSWAAKNLVGASGSGDHDLYGHWLQLKLRVAALLAILHGERSVTGKWWELADVVMKKSDEGYNVCRYYNFLEKAQKAVASGKRSGIESAAAQRVIDEDMRNSCRARVLALLGDEAVHKSGQVRRALSEPQRTFYDEVVDALVSEKLVTRNRTRSGGRPGVTLRLKP